MEIFQNTYRRRSQRRSHSVSLAKLDDQDGGASCIPWNSSNDFRVSHVVHFTPAHKHLAMSAHILRSNRIYFIDLTHLRNRSLHLPSLGLNSSRVGGGAN